MNKYFYCKELTFKLPDNFEGNFVNALELMLEYAKTKEHPTYDIIGEELSGEEATDIIELMDYRCDENTKVWVQTSIVEVDRENLSCKHWFNVKEDDCAE